MKNTKKATTLLLSSFLLILGACQQQKKQESKEDEPTQEEPRERVKPPEQIISIEESKKLFDNYTKNRVESIQAYELEVNKDENFKVARFSSFDYATFKQYMAYIEQEAKAAKVDITTLRFYFANYPNEKEFPDGRKVVHPRQNSLFVVPTIDVDGENFGFFIGANGKAELIKNAVKADGIGSSGKDGEKSYASFAPTITPAPYSGGSLAMDRSSSGPPPSPDY